MQNMEIRPKPNSIYQGISTQELKFGRSLLYQAPMIVSDSQVCRIVTKFHCCTTSLCTILGLLSCVSYVILQMQRSWNIPKMEMGVGLMIVLHLHGEMLVKWSFLQVGDKEVSM